MLLLECRLSNTTAEDDMDDSSAKLRLAGKIGKAFLEENESLKSKIADYKKKMSSNGK